MFCSVRICQFPPFTHSSIVSVSLIGPIQSRRHFKEKTKYIDILNFHILNVVYHLNFKFHIINHVNNFESWLKILISKTVKLNKEMKLGKLQEFESSFVIKGFSFFITIFKKWLFWSNLSTDTVRDFSLSFYSVKTKTKPLYRLHETNNLLNWDN